MINIAKKFVGEQDPNTHGGKLHWPGTMDGFPFRGESAPTLTADQYEEVPLVLDYHSQLFILGDPEQKKAFDQIMDRIANGWFRQVKRIDRWSDDPMGPVVWLEWVQIYGELPNKKHPSMDK